MRLTDAISEPVLCIWILAAKFLSVAGVKGFYYCTSISYDSIKTMEENMGEGKSIPGLPVYKFGGNLIPWLIYMPPKWSISFKIITEELKYLDQLNVFE